MKFSFLSLLLILITLTSIAQNKQTIHLKLTETQTENPLENCQISIPKYSLNAATDADGNAVISNVPTGRLEINVTRIGYTSKIIKELLLTSSKEMWLEISLDPAIKDLQEVKVTAASPNLSGAINDVYTFTTEQIYRFPATFFDPARLAFAYPGVTNTNDQANGMSIRGNAPEGLQWRLEGVEIVNPNHLSNAGTFSDKSTSSAGGTNILSSQMLGNMNFLVGGFPAEYGNAQSGVMDMRFRIGNNKKMENTAQIGLLGIDLSSEGPINKKSGSSYLLNYRYSFTGLLGLMGVDFGGEKIDFQDLAINLNFPTKKAGTFTAFMMGGKSSNIFKPDSDASTWTSDKDFNNIDFYSRMGLIGLKHAFTFKNKWFLQTTVANSALENLRNAYTTDPNQNVNYDFNNRNLFSGSSSLSGNILNRLLMKIGVNITHSYSKYNILNFDTKFTSISGLTAQPYIKFYNISGQKLNYNFGLQGMYYSNAKIGFAEPRLAVSYRIIPSTRLKLGYSLVSHQIQSRYAAGYNFLVERSHQFTLGITTQLSQNSEFSAEIYYQSLFNLPISIDTYASVLNGLDFGFPSQMLNQNSKSGRNYGIELNYKKLLTKGWFALVNTSLYKSEFLAFDNKYYQTRYSGNFTSNLTLGKEWEKANKNIIGINTRITYSGGYRDYSISYAASLLNRTTVYDYSQGLTKKYPDYFRTDLRIYHKKSHKKYARTISLDIQNLSNAQNFTYQYFDTLKNIIVNKYQLGLVPMFNYRWEF